VATVILLRHGRTTSNASGILAGWTPGVGLDDTGRAQATAVGQRLAHLPLAAVVTSPLQRCRETVAEVLAARRAHLERQAATSSARATRRRRTTTPEPPAIPEPVDDERLAECRYGDWQGQPLSKLAKDPLWTVVQQHPSAAVFPGPDGEPLAATAARAVAAIRDWDARITAQYGAHAVWLACSHGDVIKAIVADALGMHLDLFQRIVIDPCSLSIIRYTPTRPFLLRLNDTGGEVPAPEPPRKQRRGARTPSSDAVVGGGAGT